jgi:hypothetical protein
VLFWGLFEAQLALKIFMKENYLKDCHLMYFSVTLKFIRKIVILEERPVPNLEVFLKNWRTVESKSYILNPS